jgi:hypothetical protein
MPAASSTENRIVCEQHVPAKLLMRLSRRGLLAWCDRCKREVLVPWELVDRLRGELTEIALNVEIAQVEHAASSDGETSVL